MKSQRKRIWILVQICILAAFVFSIFGIKNSHIKIDTSIQDWTSRYTQYDGSWHIDSSYVQSNGTTDFIYGPYTELPKGSYTVNISYRCDYDQSFLPYASKGKSAFLEAGTAKLSRNKTFASYKFIAKEDIDNFEVVVKYDGRGELEIFDITIESNTVSQTKFMVILSTAFLLIHAWLFFFEKYEQRRRVLGKVLLLGFFVSLPLFVSGINIGHDLRFHLMRIEGIAQELRQGNIPVRMSSLWMDGYGYPVSVYYGDILLYFPAFLRIAGFSAVTSYKIYLLLVNMGTCLISLLCFERIFKDEKIAFVTALAYVTASYRLVDVYIRSAVGEYSALMFLPLIALGVYGIYRENEQDWASYKKNALILALGMTGVIGTHILTAEMVVILLALLCIVLWKKTSRKNTIRVYLRAILQTLCLNLYFIVPFLDYYKNVTVKINEIINDENVKKIQDGGTYIAQYFAFFQDAFGLNSADVEERMLLTPGVVLMAALIVGIVLWFYKKGNKEIYLLTAFSALVLFIASDLFPWNHLAYHYKVGNMLAQVQFPWRYIGIALIFLALLAGSILRQHEVLSGLKKSQLIGSCCIICVGMMLYFLSNYVENAYIGKFSETLELDDYRVVNGEYLRDKTNSSELSLLGRGLNTENMETAVIEQREGSSMMLYCKTMRGGTIELPMFHYKGYYAEDENGNELILEDGTNAVIKLNIPAGYDGYVQVGFRSPWYWRMGEIITLLSTVWIVMEWRKQNGKGLKQYKSDKTGYSG